MIFTHKRKKRQTIFTVCRLVSGLEDSNFRPPRPERGALPTALNPDLRCKNTLLL